MMVSKMQIANSGQSSFSITYAASHLGHDIFVYQA